jgi:hypothetical protein
MSIIQGGFSLTGSASNRLIEVSTESALQIFDNVALSQRDPHARALGLYGDVSLGRNLEGRFMSFTTPKHLLSNRKNGCTWNPKGGVRMRTDTFPTCPVEYDGEQCPDVFYGTCFERLFAPGNGVRDFAGTAEGQALLAQLLRRIYLGLGNSFFDLYNFANHPLITQANTAAFYNVSVEEWEDYMDQMMSGDCGGLITLLDELAAQGVANLALDIPNADINETTGAFTGDIIDLFETLREAAPAELKAAIENGMVMESGVLRYPIILATNAEFNAYREYIRGLAGTNELAYRYMLEGADGTTSLMRNVLVYDNMPVVRWEANSAFDAITGAQSHRVAIVLPTNFGVLHDVDDLMMFDGMGLVVQQSTELQNKGKVFMSTTFRWGAGIADPDFVVMASNVLHP